MWLWWLLAAGGAAVLLLAGWSCLKMSASKAEDLDKPGPA